MTNVKLHYDLLIDINNDPVHDPEPLKKYMDKWDGQIFIDQLMLDNSKIVLEIGVGTGRLAVKVLPYCKHFFGIDISPKTINRANENLIMYQNKTLICSDFNDYDFGEQFDVIYSSLTFLHIENKQKAITKVSELLKWNGHFVLSINKDQSKELTLFENCKLLLFPDNPNDIKKYLSCANLKLVNEIETELAYIFVAVK